MFGSIFTVIGAIFIIGELLIRKHSFAKIWYIFHLFFSLLHSILYSERKQVFAMKCELEPAINNCPFYIKTSRICANENACSFQERKNTQKQYIRKERWYEKYYKKWKKILDTAFLYTLEKKSNTLLWNYLCV